MNPASTLVTLNAETIAAIGVVQFGVLWLVASACSVGLVWAIGRWMDRQ